MNQVRGGHAARRSSPLIQDDVPRELSIQEQTTENHATPRTGHQKSLLRLDAFLGEWLTPDYFEQITPPPGSVMMLASAKGELLRRGEKVEMSPGNVSRVSLGHFPGGWNKPFVNATTAGGRAERTHQDMPATSQTFPSTRTRSGSYDVAPGNAPRFGGKVLSKLSTAIPPDRGAYVPPTPTYAISLSDPIPSGYVAHARDGCVDIDYQWDSMREPHRWGSGGEYGEEWSSMHRRFRTGLERMVNWYKTDDAALNKISGGVKDEDDDVETVLVLITHGAGCNALIGALTNRPALLDVGTSSLTMAVRKEGIPKSIPGTAPLEIADEYEMKHVASNDHLCMGSTSVQPQRQPSPRGFPNPMPSYRRFGSISGMATTSRSEGFSLGDSVFRNFSAQRVSHAPSRSMYAGRSSSGLWGSTSTSEEADDFIPNFGDPSPAPRPATSSAVDRSETEQSTRAESPRSNHGLWNGSSRPPQDREPTTKRRWTVVDRMS